MAAGTVTPPDTHPTIGSDDEETAAKVTALVGIDEIKQLSFDVGGKKPDTSKVQLVGRSVELPKAQLQKGAEYTVVMRIRVGSVHFDDKVDPATEDITGCTRKHKARIVGNVRVVPDSVLNGEG